MSVTYAMVRYEGDGVDRWVCSGCQHECCIQSWIKPCPCEECLETCKDLVWKVCPYCAEQIVSWVDYANWE